MNIDPFRGTMVIGAAHDNLTLFDIIAQSIKKDPAVAANYQEIHRRLRLGNLMILTSQGTPFIHSGQEYGRTKQFRDPAYKYPVSEDKVPNKAHLLTNEDGTPFDYPYFIHDSYDSSDAVNHFDWTKATDSEKFPENAKSRAYMKGLIALRKSTDAFTRSSKDEVEQNVSLITQPGKDGVEKKTLFSVTKWLRQMAIFMQSLSMQTPRNDNSTLVKPTSI